MGLNQISSLCFLLFLHISVSASLPQSILQIFPQIQDSFPADEFFSHRKIIPDNRWLTCDSWRLTVETNNAGDWGSVPDLCMSFVRKYFHGRRYPSDSQAVADCSLTFARKLNVSKDGKDAWVFDVDETLLSNAQLFGKHGFPSKNFNEQTFDFVPAIPSSLRLYDELKKLGFTLFILTGRNESVRTLTTKNLHYVGYNNWKRLILRGPDDKDTPAIVYKSKKRKEIEEEGYRIRGNSGDQWSDLLGYAVAERSFKLPNPMYYVP